MITDDKGGAPATRGTLDNKMAPKICAKSLSICTEVVDLNIWEGQEASNDLE